MSIESLIDALVSSRNTIRSKMVAAGQATRSDTLSTLATNLEIKSGVDAQIATTTNAANPIEVAANANNCVAIGYGANATDRQSVAVGYNSKAGYSGVSLGYQANAENNFGIAIGASSLSGKQATAIGLSANAYNIHSVAIGDNTVAQNESSIAILGASRANYAIAIGSSSNARGTYSVAIGESANTTSTNAISIGVFANSGANGTAVGALANAIGNKSISIGYNSNTSLPNSIYIGNNIRSDANSVPIVIGKYNESTADDYLEIGNGTSTAPSNILAVSNNGDLRVTGTITDGDGNVLGQGGGGSISLDNVPTSGSTSNAVSSNGLYNILYGEKIALGSLSNAAGTNSISIGRGSKANGTYSSMAIGTGAASYNSYSTVIGDYAMTSFPNSVIIGYEAKSFLEQGSTAIGAYTEIRGGYSVGIGRQVNVKGNSSIGVGSGVQITGNQSVAIGTGSSVVGNFSVALGSSSGATADNSIQLGWAYISSLKCAVQLTTSSDGRDKTDISDLSQALDFVNGLHPVTYLRNPRDIYSLPEEELTEEELDKRRKYGLYKYDQKAHEAGEKKGSRKRVGLIAQEVRDAMIEVYGNADCMNLVDFDLFDYDDVPEDVEGRYSIAYANFVPVLIKAIQELSAKVKELEAR